MLKQSRRQFSSTLLLALSALSLPFTMTGCGVFDDILLWVPIGLTALQGIVIVLGPLIGPAASAIITLIKAAFADLSGAVTAYKNDTNPADKATLPAKIRTFLGDIVTHFQDFLAALNLGNNPIVAIVIGLANVILAAVMGFMGQLPAPAGSATKSTTLATSYHVGARQFTVTPKFYKRVSDFKHDYNAAATAGGHPEISIH